MKRRIRFAKIDSKTWHVRANQWIIGTLIRELANSPEYAPHMPGDRVSSVLLYLEIPD